MSKTLCYALCTTGMHYGTVSKHGPTGGKVTRFSSSAARRQKICKVVARQDSYHADRLTQTWGTCVKGVGLASRLRDRVGDTIYYYILIVWCAGKRTQRHHTLNEYYDREVPVT